MIKPSNFIDQYMGRAEGNLSYLQFIALVKRYWEKTHPDILIRPTQGPAFDHYPVIVYGLELRKAHPSEPKIKFREEFVNVDNELIHVHGQRFQNVVSFSVYETDPILADEIIEAFEDFMDEYTWAWKKLGASEFLYNRRIPDNERTEHGDDVTKRTVHYLLTTERIKAVPVARMEQIIIDARIFLADNQSYLLEDPTDEDDLPIQTNIIDLYEGTVPEE